MNALRDACVVVGALLVLYSPVVYARSILRGDTKPHRTTRFVLFVITTLTFASLLFAGHASALWLAAASALQSAGLLVLALKRGVGGWSPVDLLCLVVAAAGIVAWQASNNPVAALYFSLGADFVGIIPAMVKTWRMPGTEAMSFYVIDGLGSAVTILAVQRWTLMQLSFPVYLALINGLMALLAVRKPVADSAIG